ncbi:hypothetical protein [Trichloromonas sp.]|uniref:hypothetical protein n=1 Tax=Trichloromonas sp. TaxID=3069249 RepID=UPI002A42C795|nr:hypothetical protein [Trichloromonas sp.]
MISLGEKREKKNNLMRAVASRAILTQFNANPWALQQRQRERRKEYPLHWFCPPACAMLTAVLWLFDQSRKS